jgi:hypothetical protein
MGFDASFVLTVAACPIRLVCGKPIRRLGRRAHGALAPAADGDHRNIVMAARSGAFRTFPLRMVSQAGQPIRSAVLRCGCPIRAGVWSAW